MDPATPGAAASAHDPERDGETGGVARSRGEMSVAQTHRIGLWDGNRLHAQSQGRGWRDVYAARATVNGWSGVLSPVDHYCLAFCLDRPVKLTRTVGGDPRQETRTVLPRQFFIIPAHEPSEWRRTGVSDMLMLYLRREMLEALGRDLASGGGGPARLKLEFGATDALLEQLAMGILRVMEGPPGAGESLYVDTLAHALGAHLLRRSGAEAPTSPLETPAARRLGRARDFIEASLAEDLSIETLADAAGMGVHAFPRAFARQFGMTPYQYVLQRRLERARELLVSTDLPIVEIALICGFSSQSHLSAAFRQRVGHSPAAYRKSGAG